jgi:hypothetical protein
MVAPATLRDRWRSHGATEKISDGSRMNDDHTCIARSGGTDYRDI